MGQKDPKNSENFLPFFPTNKPIYKSSRSQYTIYTYIYTYETHICFADGRVCIRFGMVSMDTDVEELLSLVVSTGVQLDEQVVKLTQMSDLVVKGIEQAAEDLKRETDEAIWQEGVLRHVPIVGSLYNWISPLQKPQIKGRFLSLNEGKAFWVAAS